MDIDLLKTELMRDEGCSLKAYRDSLGYWTIGYGHMIGSRKEQHPSIWEISQETATGMLRDDIDTAIERARKILKDNGIGLDSLSEVRQRVIVNMVFNLGDRLRGFRKFMACLKDEDYVGSAFQMMDSKWAQQVKARAVRLSEMMRSG